MKKIYSMLTIAIVGLSAMMMTSCTEDQMIGMSLEGTWVGNMYIQNEWSNHVYKASESEITFTSDPFRTTRGYGYWVDYYSNCSWDYVANHIRWEVKEGVLYIYFQEDDGFVAISDFRINNNHFEGYIYDDNGMTQRFSLSKVYDASYDWDDCDYGWGYWNGGYYYSKSAEQPDKEVKEFNMIEDAQKADMTEKPIRHIMKQDIELK